MSFANAGSVRMLPELVIFDCDGVLIDSELIACTIDADELSHLGVKLASEDLAAKFTGIPRRVMFATLAEEHGLHIPDDLDRRIERKILERYLSGIPAITGAGEFARRTKTARCIASSSLPSTLALGLIQADLYDLFYPNIFSTALVANGKPAPDIFLYSAARMGVRPENCVVVEDSPAGVTGARAANMRAIGFTGGAHCNATTAALLKAAGADDVVHSYSELQDLLGDI